MRGVLALCLMCVGCGDAITDGDQGSVYDFAHSRDLTVPSPDDLSVPGDLGSSVDLAGSSGDGGSITGPTFDLAGVDALACNPTTQYCPTSTDRCGFDDNFTIGCNPPIGTRPEDAPCSGTGSGDPCDKGLFCNNGLCQKFCFGEVDCVAPKVCVPANSDTATIPGVFGCQAPCTPFGNCPGTRDCSLNETDTTGAAHVFCREPGGGAVGDPCVEAFTCPISGVCEGSRCRALCTTARICESGTCEPRYGLSNGGGICL